MSGSENKPTKSPATPYDDANPDKPLWVKGAWVWAPLSKAWLLRRPEEMVRQRFIHRLHTEWGFELGQMRQERKTQHGHGSPKADVVIAESVDAAQENRDWIVVVETKAESVPIVADDYGQGESYARAVGAEFLVMHNEHETSYWRLVKGAPGTRVEITDIPKASEMGDAQRLEAIRRSTKAFTRDEFQRLLFECHSILRDNHKMDPGAAFDEISKILFIKMAQERQGRSDVFTTDRLRQFAEASLIGPDDDAVLSQLFNATKQYYRADQLFSDGDHLRSSLATFRTIVGKLERFNLSDTGDDVKGIAFEQFLGQTFRGELGQYFTPRPLVDFMVEALAPSEGEIICDPASGTGGFLIRVFEHLRTQVERDVRAGLETEVAAIEAKAKKEKWSDAKLVAALEKSKANAASELDVSNKSSRIFAIASSCIYGTDAEARAARTSKMNMIMHGDGHGGIHYHDGLLDVNGIFEGRFDIVLTNPPFGSNVGKDQIVGATEQTRVETDEQQIARYVTQYGDPWQEAHDRLVGAADARLPILELFDIGRDPVAGDIGASKVRANRPTEQLFVERCISLLRPGGRMAIVLPDGILNNPSLAWLRRYVEGRARLQAVVSVPMEVFASSKASVKTSLVFLSRFTDDECMAWATALADAEADAGTRWPDRDAAIADLRRRAETYDRTDAVATTVDLIKGLKGAQPPDDKAVRKAEADLRKLLTPGDRATARALTREANDAQGALDRDRTQFALSAAREAFSHPVFMAEVEAAGITGTGTTGPEVPNELPELVLEYHRFLTDPAAYQVESMVRLIHENSPEEPAP